MQLCIGRVPFLVCAPYFHRFFAFKSLESRYFFHDDVPSVLNRLLVEGKIHLAPASSFNYALHPEKFVLYSELCTSSRLEVQSVRLYSSFPIEELDKKNVHLTPKSATSISLLKVLFALRFKIEPHYVDKRPFDEKEDVARLLIGDEALLQNKKDTFPYVYDLATLWQDWQGMPFVFGAWSIHQSALEKDLHNELCDFLSEVNLSVNEFRNDSEKALKLWKSHYPVELASNDLQKYFNVLDYTFTDERKKSLLLFFEKCTEIGLLSKVPEMKYWCP